MFCERDSSLAIGATVDGGMTAMFRSGDNLPRHRDGAAGIEDGDAEFLLEVGPAAGNGVHPAGDAVDMLLQRNDDMCQWRPPPCEHGIGNQAHERNITRNLNRALGKEGERGEAVDRLGE